MEMTPHRVVRNLAGITVSAGSFIKYHGVWYQINAIKGFTDRIQFHWQTNNKMILQIMKKHNYLGKQLSTFFTSFVYAAVGVTILYHLSPIILDKIVPLNESRPIEYPVDIKFVSDQEKHPILASIIYYFWVGIIGAIYAGTESLTIMTCLHAASLFEVTRFFSDCSAHSFLTYIALIILGVTSLSINLFVLSQSVLHLENFREAILNLLLVIAVIQYMFLLNLAIQYVLDAAANISITIYNTPWYETSVATQKLLQIVLLRSNKSTTFALYNIFDASLRGFSVLFQSSLSYFTVLISL